MIIRIVSTSFLAIPRNLSENQKRRNKDLISTALYGNHCSTRQMHVLLLNEYLALNWQVKQRTSYATIQFESHGYMAEPGFWVYAYITSSYCWGN